ncbi:MAG: tetratricopeptide repeat protein, partial [Bacteroidota bacterium]
GQDERDEASRLLTEADRIFDEALDRAHPEAATTLMNLGHLARDARRWDEADAFYRRGLALRRSLLGPTHHSIAASLNNMAFARALSGDASGAYELYDEARRVLETSFPDGHIRTTYQLVQMGKLRRQQGRYAESAALLREALQMRQRVAAHRPRLVARARLHLAATLVMLGRHRDAERLLDLAEPHISSPEDMDWDVLHRTFAQVYAETDRPRLAARHEALRGR